ncbi:MAG: nucleoside phosphorylase [Crocinitomicaceae bacterium]|nr:nucleoside phosphorylase [Crocinitomicaceae bacterium]
MRLEEIAVSELILNKDGSVYHLALKAEHIADTVILTGDPKRVSQVSKHFDSVDVKISNREFTTHTGTFKGKRISVMSTGIGTDNIDIAINELDAALNIDPHTRQPREKLRQINLVRIGTSGALQADIPVGAFVISEFGLGFDGLLYYYDYQPTQEEKELSNRINAHLLLPPLLCKPYVSEGDTPLMNQIGYDMVRGITATASGFYGPQGRRLRLALSDDGINERLNSFSWKDHRIANFEMETSALYGLGKLLGHKCATVCVIIANRMRKEYMEDYTPAVDSLIRTVLERV